MYAPYLELWYVAQIALLNRFPLLYILCDAEQMLPKDVIYDLLNTIHWVRASIKQTIVVNAWKSWQRMYPIGLQRKLWSLASSNRLRTGPFTSPFTLLIATLNFFNSRFLLSQCDVFLLCSWHHLLPFWAILYIPPPAACTTCACVCAFIYFSSALYNSISPISSTISTFSWSVSPPLFPCVAPKMAVYGFIAATIWTNDALQAPKVQNVRTLSHA